jgi:hypothetical protein
MKSQEAFEEIAGRLYRPEPTVFPCPAAPPCPCAIPCFRMSRVATVYEPYKLPADGRKAAQ